MNQLNIIPSLTTAVKELLDVANLEAEQILIVGCSTSEIAGHKIGQNSSLDIAQQVMESLMPIVEEHSLYLAIQTCEHLNRTLVIEKSGQEKYNLEIVSVLPHEKAGGSLAATAMETFENPVVVESIQGHAGIDIGDTFIGMHLKPVVVPVRTSIDKIGYAHVTLARTRPKLIGGTRAKYLD